MAAGAGLVGPEGPFAVGQGQDGNGGALFSQRVVPGRGLHEGAPTMSWIGQQSFTQRRSSSKAVSQRLATPIRAGSYSEELVKTAKTIATPTPGRGILAIDESNATCGKMLASINVNNTEVNRQAYRQLLLTTPGLGYSLDSLILSPETLYQSTTDGKKFVDCCLEENIVPSIKVDKGTKFLEICVWYLMSLVAAGT
ncbi:hypothetical protein QQ045_032649 [Rhodiola kirilowii]